MITFIPIAVTAAAVAALPAAPPALANPCSPADSTVTTALAVTASEAPSPSPQPEPSASPTPDPSPTPTASPCPSPAPTDTEPTAEPTAEPSAEPSGTPPPPPPLLDAADSQQLVSKRPGRMTGTRLSMGGLSFDGIVDDLPTSDGPIRVLQFSMDRATTDGFELSTPNSDGTAAVLRSPELAVAGNVLLYTDRFTGKLFGAAEVTFTPYSPPQLVPSEIFFTDVDISLVYVRGDVLDADDLTALSGV